MRELSFHQIKFANEEHRRFFVDNAVRLNADCYLEALLYTLGISPDTRRFWHDIYDEATDSIIPNGLYAPWQTSGTAQITRLALQLYSDNVPTAITRNERGDIEKDFDECQRYSVTDIFNNSCAEYFYEAVKIRFLK